MNFSKPRFLRGEPFFHFQIELDFRLRTYLFSLTIAHFSIFSFYKVEDIGKGFDILGFGVHSG